MKLKYKNKIYDSEQIPLFLYFKNTSHKKDFITLLANYDLGNYTVIPKLYGALAGSVVIKDKRSKVSFCINDIEEKRIIVKGMFHDRDSDNNAMVCSPPDIPEESLLAWIEKNIEKLK